MRKKVITICLLFVVSGALFFAFLRPAFMSSRFKSRPADRESLISDCSLAIELDPENAWAFARRGHLFLVQQRADKARQDCLRALELGLENGDVLFDLISACVDLRDFETAERYCLRLPESSFAMNAEVYILWGRILLGLGERDAEALRAFDKAVALGADNDERIFAGRGAALSRLCRWGEAVELFDRALKINPDNSSLMLGKAKCLVRLGRREDAFEIIDSVKDEIDTGLRIKLAAYVEDGEFEQALVLCEQLLLKNPEDIDALTQRGNVLLHLGRFRDGIADLDVVLLSQPDNAWVYFCRGSAFVSLRQKDEALADFSRAIELAPDMIMPYIDRARIYAGRGQKDLALADLDAARRIEPQNPEIDKIILD